MTAKQRLEKYLDLELPVDVLLFHVAMALSLLECFVIVLFTILLRLDLRVPCLLFLGMLLTLCAMYAEQRGMQAKWISAVYLFLMHFMLIPLTSFLVPYAIYDFPVYFLTGIAFILILLRKKWAMIYIMINVVIDLICIHSMLRRSSLPAAVQEGSTPYSVILFGRIITALFLTGTVCGILVSYRNRVLQRETARSAAMERQAEQLSYAKNMFLVNVSHEIRTPLNAILGITELLLDLDVDDQIKENAFHMANSSKALLSITNELMDFSKLDDSDLSVSSKPYYIGDICDELVNVVSVRFSDYKTELFVEIDPDLPAQLCGDAAMIRQIMLNATTGIIKSLEKGEVYLHIWKEDLAGEQLRLWIEVCALGEFRYSYKEWLYRNDYADQDYDEAVIPLTHRLVQLMGGGLHMEEERTKRRYTYDIPQTCLSANPLVDKSSHGNLRVLFFENSALQGDAFAQTLRAMGVEFCQALSNEAFLKECVDQSYTHLMIAMERYDGMKDRLEQLLDPQSVILIGSGIRTYENMLIRTTFDRPVNCLNLDALLSGRQNSTIRHIGYRGGFVCPEARVMVVDDNMVNLEVATSFLNRYQAQVLVAVSGKECLTMLQEEQVDLIFLDYMMPEMDGIDTLKNIRGMENPWLKQVPVVALTANAVSGARDMFLDAGFDEYISKPIERDKFEKVLRTFLPEKKIINTADRKK